MTNESLVMEVAEWLEKAAHETHALERIAKAILRGLRSEQDSLEALHRFSIEATVNLEKQITTVRYSSKHQVKRFQASTGLSDEDMKTLKEWLSTTPDENIAIDFETHDGKEWICLRQLTYVPTDQRAGLVQELADLTRRIKALDRKKEDARET